MRRRAALLALLAVSLHAMSPLLAAMPRAMGEPVEICTAHGAAVVELPGEAPAGAPLDCCKGDCCHGAVVARPAPPAACAASPEQPTPRLWRGHVPATPRTAARPRAPPALG